MEKDNKYYEVIENMVKSHKKYNGYDAILDDIIDDIYKHAKSVISTVKEDSVITAYLEKLTSVSIITVPKKLNFHTELKHRVISTEVQNIVQTEPAAEITENIQPVVQETAEPVQKANKEFVDKMINSIDTASITDTPADNTLPEVDDNEILDSLEDNNLEILEPAEETLEEISTEEEEEEPVAVLLEEDDTETLEPVTEDIAETIEPVTEEIIEEDNTANLEPVEEITEENIAEDIELAEEIQEEDDDIETLEPVTDDSIESLEPTEEIADENEIETLEPATENIFGEDNSDDTEIEEEFAAENDDTEILELATDDEIKEVSEGSYETGFDDTEILNTEEENNFEIMPDAEDNGIGFDSFESDMIDLGNESSDIQSLEPEQNTEFFESEENNFDDSFDITDNTEIELVEDESAVKTEEPAEENEELIFKPVDYSMFNYIPEAHNESINIQDIETKLAELNSQRPELNIFAIFDLKYKQNLPITKIAEELQMEKQDVITALDEIVELI